jgi:hypothetical protein
VKTTHDTKWRLALSFRKKLTENLQTHLLHVICNP